MTNRRAGSNIPGESVQGAQGQFPHTHTSGQGLENKEEPHALPCVLDSSQRGHSIRPTVWQEESAPICIFLPET